MAERAGKRARAAGAPPRAPGAGASDSGAPGSGPPGAPDGLEGPRVCVGAVAGAFGVQGEVRLKSFCAEPEAIVAYGPLSDEAGARLFEVRLTRPVKAGFAARLSGVGSREAAEALRGTRLYAPRARLPALPDDEFYHADLIGLAVQDTGGAPLGTVKAVHDFGAGDVLEIAGPPLPRAVMLPFTRAAVPTVDLASGRLVADPPPGILDDAGNGGAAPEGPDADAEDDAPEPGA